MPIRSWLRLLAAPLRWLEQAQGWRRPALLGLYALILGAGGVFLSREVVLWEIPDVAEPFGPVAARSEVVPDADNALVYYQRAAGSLVRHPGNIPRRAWRHRAHQVGDWNAASPEIRSQVAANRVALDTWRLGTACDAAAALTSGPALDQSDLLILSDLATLEATRLRAEGDLAGAWVHYLGVVRSSIHASRLGGVGFVRLEAQILDSVLPLIRSWAADPAMTPALLGAAGADLASCRELMPALSDVVRAGYPATLDTLGRPDQWRSDLESNSRLSSGLGGWNRPLTAVQNWLRNEPKRSQRVFRLLTAHHLAHLDRPAGDRPRLVSPRYMIFKPDASTPPSLAAIKPSRLAKWANASGCRTELADLGSLLDSAQNSRTLLDSLRLDLVAGSPPLDPARATVRRQRDRGFRPFKAVSQAVPADQSVLAF